MGNAQTQTQVPDSNRVPVGTNYMLALMGAVNKDQTTLSEQQITDAKSTMIATQLESNLYNYWMKKLTSDAGNIPKSGKDIAYYQGIYQKDSAAAQSMETQQDGAVQASQGQTSSDATNLQMKAQMVQGVTSILTALVNYLGQVTA